MSDRTAVFYYVARLEEGKGAEAVDLTHRVEGFTYIDREGGMDKLALTIDNKSLANFDDPLFEAGASLRCSFGSGKGAAPVRDFVIKKVTGGRRLSVNAVSKMGAGMDTIKKRRCFVGLRRSEVVSKLAKENGFQEPDIEDTPETFVELQQGNLTDGQLIKKLANLEGFEFYIDFDGLHWHRRRVGQAPIREYIYYVDPEEGEVIDFNVTNDVTRRPGKVTVCSRDPLDKSDIIATASNSEDPDRDVMQGLTGTFDNETGKLVVKNETVYEETVASNVETQEDAVREAKGKYRKMAQGVVKMSLELRGDPALVAKTVVLLTGFGKRLSGLYYVQEVTHALTGSGGYRMTAKLITDGFQGGKGKGKGASDDSSALLLDLANALRTAGVNDLVGQIDGETGELSAGLKRRDSLNKEANAAAEVLELLSKFEGNTLATGAKNAAGVLARLAANAQSAGAKNLLTVATGGASALRSIAQAPAAIEAEGKKNDKGVNDSQVRPVNTVDQDGNPVTKYQKTGGREK